MPDLIGESRRQRYLRAMDVDLWRHRDREPEVGGRPAGGDAVGERVTDEMSLEDLQIAVAGCHQCDLHAGRTHTVFGTGDPAASCMIIGEAPGAEEDRKGEPFVGRAGQLLNAMLRAIGMSRDAVYIANIVKCRPPKNRDPRPEEMVACSAYLRRQIALIKPRVILAVGRVAAQHLTGSTTPIGRMRGQSYAYENGDTRVPIVVTYHPAYLLRSPLEKRKSWEDLKRARTLLESHA